MLAADRLDQTFAALADPTRRAIVVRLAKGEASVNELIDEAPSPMTLHISSSSSAKAPTCDTRPCS